MKAMDKIIGYSSIKRELGQISDTLKIAKHTTSLACFRLVGSFFTANPVLVNL